jgi:WD40 repeat protein
MSSRPIWHLIRCLSVAFLCVSSGMAQSGDLKDATKPAHTLMGHKTTVFCSAFSPDGRLLATGDYKGKVIIWDWQQSKRLLEINASDKPVRYLAFSNDSKELATAGSSSEWCVWQVKTGKIISRNELKNSREVAGLSFTGSESPILIQDHMGEISIWDLQEQTSTPWNLHRLRIGVIRSPDQTLFATGWPIVFAPKTTIRLINFATGDPAVEIQDNSIASLKLCFAKDSSFIAAASSITRKRNDAVHLWKTKDGKMMSTFRHGLRWVSEISISSDNRYICLTGGPQGSNKASIEIWRIEKTEMPFLSYRDGDENAFIPAARGHSYTTAAHPKKSVFATAGTGSSVLVWSIPRR